MARRDNELYRGKRRRLNVLALALSALAMLAVAVIVLFYAFQQYIVFDQDGISLELPLLATPEAAVDESGERVFEEVQVQLEIGEADYSNVEAVAGEGLEPLRAIFVPAASVNSVSVQPYVNLMGSYNANALVLEVKPTSGQLVWASSSETAEGFAVNGTQNMAGLVQSLKEQDIYLVAQVSCLVDDLMSERAATSALHLIDGSAYSDAQGGWMDPYSSTVVDYLTELCEELAGYGFDEILLEAVSLPVTGASIHYNAALSYAPTPTTAVCTLAQTLSAAVRGAGAAVSAIIDSQPLAEGQTALSGHDIGLFTKVFDRLCCYAATAWQAGANADTLTAPMTVGDASLRYAPIMNYAPEMSCYIIQVPSYLIG